MIAVKHAPLRAAFAFAAMTGFCVAAPALAQDGPPPTAVTVVTLKSQNVTLTSTLPGRVIASAVAEVRPQVAGIITERLFEEGGPVKLGDALYRIDPALYEAQVAAAKAAVAQAQATFSAARKEADRLTPLLGRNVVSEQSYDATVASRDVAEAALQVAKAQLQTAEINLDRTTIRAPLSGAIGLSQASQGFLATAGQADPLAVIRTLDPVYVDVTQSAADLIRWRSGRTDAQLGDADLTVTLTLADGQQYDHIGTLTAAEPHVNEQTGVVVLRMDFPNPRQMLLPGMYVQVEMPQGVAENVILAPQQGISRDRRGRPVAMVVNADNVVEQRLLTVLRDRGNQWVVSDGLADGDRIIVEGLQKVRADMKVAPQERPAAAAAN